MITPPGQSGGYGKRSRPVAQYNVAKAPYIKKKKAYVTLMEPHGLQHAQLCNLHIYTALS